MKKRIVYLASILAVSACATKPYVASNTEIDEYINSLIVTEESISFVHSNYGEFRVDQAPLAPVYENCKSRAFADFSITMGSHTITDYEVMKQIEFDYLSFLLHSFQKGKAQPNDYGSGAHAGSNAAVAIQTGSAPNDYNSTIQRNTIFDDKKVRSEAYKIAEAQEQKKQCLKSSGWVIKR